MKNSTCGQRRPRRRRPAAAHTVAATIAVAGLALLAAACGGSGQSSAGFRRSPGGAGSARSPSALAYSACVRAHGVPNYPDPDSSGQLPKTDAQLLGVSGSQYQAARHACRHLLPTGGSLQQQEDQCMQNSDCSPALVQLMLTADRKLAQCMRSHGVPNFPDPVTDSHGPVFNITKAGISDAASHTSQFEAKLTECGRLVGGDAPEAFE
jgi:hypothetical protein